jgi:hypothetical protein
MSSKKKSVPRKAPKKKVKSRAVAVVKKQEVAVVQPQQSQVLSLNNPAQIMEFGKVLKSYIVANGLSVKIEDKDYPLCGAWKFAGMNFGLTAVPVEITPKHKDGQYITILFAEREFEFFDKKAKPPQKKKYKKVVPIFSGFTNHKDVIDEIRQREGEGGIKREITRPYYSYECTVEVHRFDGHVVTKGKSVCTNLESAKAGFDEYAVMGQAQTRTISRALKNLLDFVLQSAGMEPTPGEEMQGHEQEHQVPDEPPFAPPPDAPVKNTPSVVAWEKLVVRAQKGEVVSEMAKAHMSITDEQYDALKILESNYREQHPEATVVE